MTQRDPLAEELEIDPADEEEVDDPEAHRKANRQLQGHNKKLESENAELRARVMSAELREIGLDPEKGLGKAIAKEYKGEMTTEAIAKYATDEYGHEPAESQPAAPPPEVAQGKNIETLQQGSESITPPPALTPAQESESRMHDPNATRAEAVQSIANKVNEVMPIWYPDGTSNEPNQ